MLRMMPCRPAREHAHIPAALPAAVPAAPAQESLVGPGAPPDPLVPQISRPSRPMSGTGWESPQPVDDRTPLERIALT